LLLKWRHEINDVTLLKEPTCILQHTKERLWRYARCWWHLTLHIINIEKNDSRLLFHFFFFLICVCIPWVWLGWRWWGVFYLCLHTVGLVRMEVVWVCFGVLFYISEFHFLFLLIFILFWLACIYLCCWCFPLGVYFNVCLLAHLFRLYSLLIFIYCLCYVTVLYHFFFESISCSKTRLSYSVCLLIDCIRCNPENFS
jgi:hypothetical protein